MKNEISHSSDLQQETGNIIKPEFFFQETGTNDINQEYFSSNDQTYPYINLHISFDNISRNNQILSYFCTLSINSNGIWKEIDRTEIKLVDHYEKFIKFTKFFTIAYIFQVNQQIRFCIYQQKQRSNSSNDNQITSKMNEDYRDFRQFESYTILGECEILLSSIALVSSSKEIKIPLKNINQNPNEIVTFLRIKPEQVDHCSSIVNGQIICEKLKKSRWMTCNEPFFVISKKKQILNSILVDLQDPTSDSNSSSQSQNESNSDPHNFDFIPIYQSEVNKKMQFKPFSIPYQILCNMDKDIPIRISFYCQRKHKKPKIIGFNDTTFSRLFLSIGQVLPVFQHDNTATIVGSFKIVNLTIHHKSNLYDYLQSGIKLNYITVIDFTSLLHKEKEELSIQKTIDNSNYSSSSSSHSLSSPNSSSMTTTITTTKMTMTTKNGGVSNDTNFNDNDSKFSTYHLVPPQKKRKNRNSYMETKTNYTQSYYSSSSSSSPNPFPQSLETDRVGVGNAYSCAMIENLELNSTPGFDRSMLTERCIKSVGDILSNYNNSNLYPTLGFGAEVDGKLKNCFPLSLNVNNPCVNGIDGVIKTFQKALSNDSFKQCGPTLFSPVIKYASRYAIQSFEKNRSYSVLVIITEGIINDMQDTIDALVDASRLPLSIILVGIKDKKLFETNSVIENRIKSEMSILNSFNDKNVGCNKSVDESNKNASSQNLQLISRNGRKMERNVVKFVLFDDSKSDDWNTFEILKDVPSQLVEWTEMNGIKSYNT